MSFLDILRRKTQNKDVQKEAAAIIDRHSAMISHITDLEQGITNYPESWRFQEWSASVDQAGQPNGLVKTTKYADGVTPTEYEFLVYKGLNNEGLINTQYYSVVPTGDFSTPHNLAAFTLKYNANIKGQYVPCETVIRTNGASVEFLPINTRNDVKPMDPEADKSACLPDSADIRQILAEYARVTGISLDRGEDTSEDIYGGFNYR